MFDVIFRVRVTKLSLQEVIELRTKIQSFLQQEETADLEMFVVEEDAHAA